MPKVYYIPSGTCCATFAGGGQPIICPTTKPFWFQDGDVVAESRLSVVFRERYTNFRCLRRNLQINDRVPDIFFLLEDVRDLLRAVPLAWRCEVPQWEAATAYVFSGRVRDALTALEAMGDRLEFLGTLMDADAARNLEDVCTLLSHSRKFE